MIKRLEGGVYLTSDGKILSEREGAAIFSAPDTARAGTMSYKIMRSHCVNPDADNKMRIKFDALISHDITYVGIIQTARASGLKKFPVPYALTNCRVLVRADFSTSLTSAGLGVLQGCSAISSPQPHSRCVTLPHPTQCR